MVDFLGEITTNINNNTSALDKLESLANRDTASRLSMVSNIEDPLNQRRVKVQDEHRQDATDFALRHLDCPFWDPPLPRRGMTLISSSLDGDRHNRVYNGVVVNDLNPPFAKADPINDDWRRIPGTSTLQIDLSQLIEVGVTQTTRAEENIVIEAGKTITIRNDVGCELTLDETGFILLKDAFGRRFILGAR